MKNGTLNRMLLALIIAFGFSLTGCLEVQPTTRDADANPPSAPELVQFDPGQVMQNKSWDVSCIDTGDASMNQLCAELAPSQEFTRIMHATKDGSAMLGIAVWKSQSDFNNCGAIDLTDNEVSALGQSDDIVFDAGGITSGASYVNDQNLCPTKDGQAPQSYDDIPAYQTLTELDPNGVTYTYVNTTMNQFAQDCYIIEEEAVEYSTYDGVHLIAAVTRNDQLQEQSPGACSGASPVVGQYGVLLTPQ